MNKLSIILPLILVSCMPLEKESVKCEMVNKMVDGQCIVYLYSKECQNVTHDEIPMDTLFFEKCD